VEAVAVRHEDVAEDEVVALARQSPARLLGRARGLHLVALALEEEREEVEHAHLVVGDEQAVAHQGASTGTIVTAASTTGSSTVMVVPPPGRLSTPRWPPWSCTMR